MTIYIKVKRSKNNVLCLRINVLWPLKQKDIEIIECKCNSCVCLWPLRARRSTLRERCTSRHRRCWCGNHPPGNRCLGSPAGCSSSGLVHRYYKEKHFQQNGTDWLWACVMQTAFIRYAWRPLACFFMDFLRAATGSFAKLKANNVGCGRVSTGQPFDNFTYLGLHKDISARTQIVHKAWDANKGNLRLN